tara:strand:+ start:598 stop:720 length:123 start_codon:yes stop_codon:yes gene_type:complete
MEKCDVDIPAKKGYTDSSVIPIATLDVIGKIGGLVYGLHD